ncbi:hypothetical protein BJ742DRAFT_869139 [Cladochytrium replicatum]|nr:hypothetical protein BJ742DRAFT_869139 [Cladochytrium replicatum]
MDYPVEKLRFNCSPPFNEASYSVTEMLARYQSTGLRGAHANFFKHCRINVAIFQDRCGSLLTAIFPNEFSSWAWWAIVSPFVDPESLEDALRIVLDLCRITDDNLCEAIETMSNPLPQIVDGSSSETELIESDIKPSFACSTIESLERDVADARRIKYLYETLRKAKHFIVYTRKEITKQGWIHSSVFGNRVSRVQAQKITPGGRSPTGYVNDPLQLAPFGQ